MSTTTYDDLVSDILMYAPHCPEHTATHAVKLTVIDFCRRTQWWKYTTDPLPLVGNVATYDVDDIPSGTEPITVVAAWYNNRPLWPIGFASRNRFQLTNLSSQTAAPQAFSMESPSQLTLLPTPKDSEIGALVLTVAIQPTRSATGADTEMMNRYTEAFVSGALARILTIPNQPFTSPDMALARERMYREEVTKAKIDANKQLTAASLRVQPRTP